jgi:hypothetical protein
VGPTAYEDVIRIHKAHASNLKSGNDARWADKVRSIEFYREVGGRYGMEELSNLLTEEELSDLIAIAVDASEDFSLGDIGMDE